MYYSYVEIEYVATNFSPARTDLALKLLKINMWNRVKNANTGNQCLLGFFILEKQLASQNVFLIRFELSITAYLLYYIDLHLYSHYCFSKISRPFCASRNWWTIVVFLQRNSLTIMIVSQKYRELLQPYSHDCFAKILRTFCASRN